MPLFHKVTPKPLIKLVRYMTYLKIYEKAWNSYGGCKIEKYNK